MEQVLKASLKSSPISTLATGLVYFIFKEVLGKEENDFLIVLVLIMTFIFSMFLLVFNFMKGNAKGEENTIKEIQVDRGDVFVGNKKRVDEVKEIKGKISKVKVGKGDVFIGNKK